MTEKNGLFYYSCDENQDNYSQRRSPFVFKKGDSVIDKNGLCNVHSMVMAALYAGYKLPSGKYGREPDNFADFIVTDPRVDAYYKKVMPAMWKEWNDGKKDAYTPMEIHSVLAYAFNIWLDGEKDQFVKFYDNLNFKAALYNNFVRGSLPIVISGSFPKSTGTRLNHIVTATGVVYDANEIAKATRDPKYIPTPKFVKVDDPYGDTLHDWQGSGNNILLPWAYCIKNLKPLNSENVKWGHIFQKPAAIV